MGAYWILLIAAVVVVVQGKIFKRTALQKLNYSRSFKVSTCYEGDSVELIEIIENRKALPVPWLRVESQFRSGLAFDNQLNLTSARGNTIRTIRASSVCCLGPRFFEGIGLPRNEEVCTSWERYR